jgi:hypothetical protein
MEASRSRRCRCILVYYTVYQSSSRLAELARCHFPVEVPIRECLECAGSCSHRPSCSAASQRPVRRTCRSPRVRLQVRRRLSLRATPTPATNSSHQALQSFESFVRSRSADPAQHALQPDPQGQQGVRRAASISEGATVSHRAGSVDPPCRPVPGDGSGSGYPQHFRKRTAARFPPRHPPE